MLGRTKTEFIMRDIDKYKPAVTKTFLLFLAGMVWECVGIVLLFLAFSWLTADYNINIYLYAGAGIVLGLSVHHFAFLKIVDTNLKRLLQMNGMRCLFSFIPWKSYLVIVAMIAMGAVLRHSIIPKKNLAILYIGIGLALILSSVRYIRIFYREIKRQKVA